MRRKRNCGHRAQIVDPEQVRVVLARVVPADEQLDVVRIARAKRVCDSASDPGGSAVRSEGVVIADLVQAQVAFDVFGELDSVT